MLIAQITDVHVGYDPGNPDEDNVRRLEAVVSAIAALDVRPAVLLATGDLADKGDGTAYARLKALLAPLEVPVLPVMGNHDRRAAFAAAFPDAIGDDGFAQYEWSAGGLRVLVLDTVEEGRHGGAFCERRARWLAARLDQVPDQPTMLVLHHPPIETGIGWLTTVPEEPWVRRLGEALAGRTNIVALAAGHIHRAITGRFAEAPVIVCPPVAPTVALALAPLDPDRPDGRAMVVDAPPGFALHLWTGTALVSHVTSATQPPVLARFDETMQPLVRALYHERPGGGEAAPDR